MTTEYSVSYLVEGELDASVVCRILEEIGLTPGRCYGREGKRYINKRLKNFNKAAAYQPLIVMRDLDRDADCAPELVQWLVTDPAPNLIFRVAVPEVEAWLLADRKAFARFLGVAQKCLPADPEGEYAGKKAVITAATQSRRQDVKNGLPPLPKPGSAVGPRYGLLYHLPLTHPHPLSRFRPRHSPFWQVPANLLHKPMVLLREFVTNHWSPERAMANGCDSLERFWRRLGDLREKT